jgi:hypothetical protein
MTSLADQAFRATPIRVSSASLWSDDIWRLDGVTPGANRADFILKWDFSLGDASSFADPAWSAFRTDAKTFLWSLKVDPPRGLARVQDATVMRAFGLLRVLIRWMAAHQLTSFSALTEVEADRYIDVIALRRSSTTGKPISAVTRGMHARVIRLIYQQGDKLAHPMVEEPFPGKSAGLSRSGATAWTHTPDEIAQPLLEAALWLIGEPADEVLMLRGRAQGVYDAMLKSGRSQTRAGLLVQAAMAGESLMTMAGGSESLTSTKQLRHRLDRIYDACFIVIAYLVGARLSEIAGLTTDCLENHSSADGQEQFTYLVGRIWKMSPDGQGRPHRWVAPAPVVRAIEVLERLSEPLRRRAGRNELFLVMASTGLIGPAPRVALLSGAVIGRRLNALFAPFIGLPDWRGRPWRLSTHQGRKTFARFVGKRDRTGLEALRDHFGHVNRVMTDRSYVGTDFELADLIDAQTLQETRSVLEDLLTARALAGKAGRRIADRSRFRGRTIDTEVRAYVDQILSETDMRLGVCDWGYCVYRQESSACQGDRERPNPALRTQSACVTCANFAVSDKHRPVWASRRERNLALLEHSGLDPASRALARARADECDIILSALAVDQGACHGG